MLLSKSSHLLISDIDTNCDIGIGSTVLDRRRSMILWWMNEGDHGIKVLGL
jgi:hypothetical protein